MTGLARESLRLAAVGDLHCCVRKTGDALVSLLGTLSGTADVLLLCGDLTDYGLPEEAHHLAKQLAAVKIPIVGVLGNHDHESGQAEAVKRILGDAGMIVLDGDTYEVHGVGFAGVKGFGGGFGGHSLEPWGEEAVKRFVREAVDESLKLQAALARLSTPQRIALLHYSPIQATVEGEPPETFPFLGSSRLEDGLTRYPVAAVFHGHAHHGRPEGRTSNGIPVYNVAMPLLMAARPDHPPFRLMELRITVPQPEWAAERLAAQPIPDPGSRREPGPGSRDGTPSAQPSGQANPA